MKHVTDRLPAYLDGELSAAEAGPVEMHLHRCATCRRELESLRAIWQDLDGLAVPHLEQPVWPGVAARVAGRRNPRRLPAGLAAAAVAAGLFLGIGLGRVLPGPGEGSGPASLTTVSSEASEDDPFLELTTLDQLWWSVGEVDQEAGS